MVSYRPLINGVSARLKLPFDSALTTVSAAVRALAHEVTRAEAVMLKANVPIELRQLIVESRVPGTGVGRHDRTVPIEHLRLTLDIDAAEAKRRLLGVVTELRSHVTPWDDVAFLEFLDRLTSEFEAVFEEARVA